MDSGLHVSKRLDELDSLRGFAAISVVFYHFKLFWLEEAMHGASQHSKKLFGLSVAPFSAGHQSVVLFFVLSGLVLSIPAIDSKAQPYAIFVLRRVFRIYVPYLAALVLAVLGNIYFCGSVTQSAWLNKSWSSNVDWRSVAQHIIFVGQYNTDQFDNPIWSLVQEMRISFVFPILCAFVLRLKPFHSLIVAASLSCLSAFAMVALHLTSTHISPFMTLHYASLFVLGIYVARRRDVISVAFTRLSRLTKMLIAFLSLALYVYTPVVFDYVMFRVTHVDLSPFADWFTALGAIGLIVFSLNAVLCRRILLCPPVRALGKVSYSLYLLHVIVLLLSVHILYGRVPLLFILTLCLLAVIMASWAFYRFVELPSMILGYRLSGYLKLQMAAGVKGCSRPTVLDV